MTEKNVPHPLKRAFNAFFTFGLANLKTTTAVETTKEMSPRVSAFQAFNAIRAKANGSNTVVLNFKPSKNGINTFLTRPRPAIEMRHLK